MALAYTRLWKPWVEQGGLLNNVGSSSSQTATFLKQGDNNDFVCYALRITTYTQTVNSSVAYTIKASQLTQSSFIANTRESIKSMCLWTYSTSLNPG